MTKMIPLAENPEPSIATGPRSHLSSLVLAENLLLLAQEADRAGHRRSASRLIAAAYATLDDECIRSW